MPISPEMYKGQSGPGFYTMASLPDFMLPGYGQIVAGEKRKGILFLVAHVLNLSVLGLIVFSQSLSQSLSLFSKAYNLHLNSGLNSLLKELTLGSPDAFIALTIWVAFALFAARDAYEYRLKLKRQALYHDHVLAMPEAVSSSYIFHIVFLLVCMALAFFFLIPLAPPRQITDIEFIQTEENTHEKPVTKIKSIHNAKAAGVVNKTPPKEAAQKQATQKQATQKQAAQKETAPPTVHAPVPVKLPQPTPQLLSKELPRPTLNPVPAASAAAPKMPTPSATNPPRPILPPTPNLLALAPNAAPSPLRLPVPAPNSGTVGSASNTPRPHAQSVSGNQNGQPTPAPVSVVAGAGSSKGTDNGPLTPAKIGKDSSSEKGDTGNAPVGPTPKRGTSGGAISPAGTVPGPVLGAPKGSAGPGKSADGEQNNGPRPGNSAGSESEIDWSAYMSDLQRRIKHAWFPSKVGESKRVKVIFTVHLNGEMSNLRIIQSSGLQVVDAAALKAVEASAPFRHLPEHAPASVDIEFTFDYNVFNGTLR